MPRTLNGLSNVIFINDELFFTAAGDVGTGLIKSDATVGDTYMIIGGTNCNTVYTPATKTLTINATGGTMSSWDLDDAAGNLLTILDADKITIAGVTSGYVDDLPIVTNGGVSPNYTCNIQLGRSLSLVGNALTNGILRWDGTGLPTPAANVITQAPATSILTPLTTCLNTSLGTVAWEIQTSNDIDVIDAAGNPFFELDPSADRAFICDDTQAFFPVVTLDTRLVVGTTTAGATSTNTVQLVCGTTNSENFINFGDRNGRDKGQFYSFQSIANPVSNSCSFHAGFIDNGTTVTPPNPSYVWQIGVGTIGVDDDRNTFWVDDNYNGAPAVTQSPYYTRFLIGAEPFFIMAIESVTSSGAAININNSVTALPFVFSNQTAPPGLTNPLVNEPDFRMYCSQWWSQVTQVVLTYGPVAQFTGIQFTNGLMEGVYEIKVTYSFTWRTTNITDAGAMIDISIATGENPGGGGLGTVTQGNQVHTAVFAPANTVPLGRTLTCSGTAFFFWGATLLSTSATPTPQCIQIWYNRNTNAANSTAVIRVDEKSTIVYVRRIA